MRYIKLLISVLVLFILMLFFVQNMVPLSQEVVLKFDLMILEPYQSAPIAVYSLLVIGFTIGALLILFMLMWDRIALSTRCKSATSKATGLEKKLSKAETNLAQYTEKSVEKEATLIAEIQQLKLDLDETRQSLDDLRKNYNQ